MASDLSLPYSHISFSTFILSVPTSSVLAFWGAMLTSFEMENCPDCAAKAKQARFFLDQWFSNFNPVTF